MGSCLFIFFFSSRRRHTRLTCDWSSDVCSSDLEPFPGVGGTVTFPGNGSFGITAMTPATVDVAGGTLVTITGTALPANPRVLVGTSATATVITSSATSLAFRAPARTAGVYDVHVFAADGTEQVLTGALTYVAAAAGGSGTDTGAPGTGTGGTGASGTGTGTGRGDAGAGTPGTGTGTGAGTPGTGTGSGTGGSGSGSGGSGSGGSGPTAPVVLTGLGGERLVRTTKFAALGAIWSMDCSTSCSGTAI